MAGNTRTTLKIRLRDGLPYVTVVLSRGGQQMELQRVVLDTGSAGTVFSADTVLPIGLQYEADDFVHRIRGAASGTGGIPHPGLQCRHVEPLLGAGHEGQRRLAVGAVGRAGLGLGVAFGSGPQGRRPFYETVPRAVRRMVQPSTSSTTRWLLLRP